MDERLVRARAPHAREHRVGALERHGPTVAARDEALEPQRGLEPLEAVAVAVGAASVQTGPELARDAKGARPAPRAQRDRDHLVRAVDRGRDGREPKGGARVPAAVPRPGRRRRDARERDAQAGRRGRVELHVDHGVVPERMSVARHEADLEAVNVGRRRRAPPRAEALTALLPRQGPGDAARAPPHVCRRRQPRGANLRRSADPPSPLARRPRPSSSGRRSAARAPSPPAPRGWRSAERSRSR